MTTISAALRDRRFLLSSWPWRALTHLLTTAVVLIPIAGPVWLIALPWLATAGELRDGRLPAAPVVVLMAFGVVLVAAAGPLVAVPLAVVERRRLAVIDDRPLTGDHRHVPGDPWMWLRVRYTEAATWREVGYGLGLALLAPVVYGALALAGFVIASFVASPLFVGLGQAQWQVGPFALRGTGPAVLLCLAGLALVAPFGYLVGLVAAGQVAAARALLGNSGGNRLQEVSRSRARLADAFEAERQRIQRDLHDGAQHQLTSLSLHLGMARLDLPADSPAAVPLEAARQQAKDLMEALREVVHGIRPQTLTELGLLPALYDLAGRSPVPVSVTGTDALTRPPERIETAAYFVASEALGNVVRHAAAGRADVRVDWSGDLLVVEVRDDGHGGADPAAGSGLTGLADRVAAAGGRLLLSSPAGGGTVVRAELPCRQ